MGKVVQAPYDDREALAEVVANSDVVTYEFENVPAESASYLRSNGSVLPPPQALRAAQDRLAEKQLFNKAQIPTATFWALDSPEELGQALDATGLPAVIKTRRFGYDGKGQRVVHSEAEAAVALAELSCGGGGGMGLIVEKFVNFTRELSVLAAAGADGETVFYPLTENHHRCGILRLSVGPAPELSPTIQARAEEMANQLIGLLDYTGVLAIELFESRDGELLANEMAPRVHNSGHWTLDGAATSQFENHIRAVTGLSLASPEPVQRTVMINLIGSLPEVGALAGISGAHLHLYGKEPRPGRKLGHVNVTGDDEAAVTANAAKVWELLPDGASSGRFPLA